MHTDNHLLQKGEVAEKTQGETDGKRGQEKKEGDGADCVGELIVCVREID